MQHPPILDVLDTIGAITANRVDGVVIPFKECH